MSKLCRTLTLLSLALLLVSTPLKAEIEITGAGATFPYPLYAKMFDVYHKQTGAKVNYQAIGSGGGILQLINKTVDFGATDAFMSEAELKKSDNPVLHIPICLGAVVATYNLPGSPKINFTADIIADIFLGVIKKWNDPRLAAINPEVKLPGLPIMVVHRSDGSGTTYIFSDYLSKVSSVWAKQVGCEKSLNWPTGLGGKGNPGVAGLVRQMPGAIGYVELIYALQNKMAYGKICNRAGTYVDPSLQSVTAAAGVDLPNHTRVSIVNTGARDGYPISGFTWLLIYKEQNYNNRAKTTAEQLVKLAWWMIHDGQKEATAMQYSPLPAAAVSKAEKLLASVTFAGAKLLP